MLLTNTQVSKLCRANANSFSANIKLSKTQLHKLGQPGGFLGRCLGPLLKTELLLMKNVLKPLSKSVLLPLGIRAEASATDAAIQKKMFESGTTILIIFIEEMNDIMKIVKSLKESGLLIKGVSKTGKHEAKEQKDRFLSMLLGTLSVSLLGNALTFRGVRR